MNEELLENANLYALGLLAGDAVVAFEQELRVNPELRQQVHALQEAVLVLARSAPQCAPPEDLRAELLTQLFGESDGDCSKTDRKVPLPGLPTPPPAASTAPGAPAAPPQSGGKLLHFIPWAVAAGLVFFFYTHTHKQVEEYQAQTSAAQADALEAREREKHLLEAVSVSEAARAAGETALAGLRSRLAEAGKALASLGTERETLAAEIATLRRDNALHETRIAVLGSLLKNQPSAVAVSLWRQEQQEGLLVVENLPSLPAGKDYQLWVIDPNLKTPVSAGVFKVDAQGKVRIQFKPDRTVQSASKFAVTVEKEGGSELPDLDQLVVIGG